MEIIGVIAFIWIVWAIIAGIVNKHRQKIRDQIAHEILYDKFDSSKEKEQVLSIRKRLISVKEKIKFLTPNIVPETNSNSEYPVYIRTSCPSCRAGKLIKRKSTYGFFLGCSNYPKCRFIKNTN